MTKVYTSIAIENASCEVVKSFLVKALGPAMFNKDISHVLGMHFDVIDVQDAIDYAKQFLTSHGLEEAHPFYREFDMSLFNVEIDLYSSRGHFSVEFQPVVADQIARVLTAELQTRAVIKLEDGNIPFRVYANGKQIRDLREYYQEHFKGRHWVPRELC